MTSCRCSEIRKLTERSILMLLGTVFAYGQTSSGKTFTMNGSQTDPGVIHRAVRDIFLKIQEVFAI